MASKTIPELNPATTFNGNALIPIDTGTQSFKITATNFAKALADLAPSESFVSKWVSTTTYLSGDMVYYGGEIYSSLAGSNLNKNPATAFNFWKKIKSPGLNPQASPALAVRALSTWTARTMPETILWTKIIWVEEHACFYAIAQTGTNRIAKSTNGTSWTAITTLVSDSWQGITYSPELNRLVVVSLAGVTAYSNDAGATWTDSGGFPAGLHEFKTIKWIAELGIFLCVLLNSDDANEVVWRSPDGITWTFDDAVYEVWQDFVWVPKWSLVIAVGSSIMTSPDAVTWTERTEPSASLWSCIAYSPSLEIAVALSRSSGKVMQSRNGIDWTESALATDSFWAVEWIEELGLFVAVANSGSSNYLHTSPDGVTWTPRTLPASSYFTSIAWSPQLGIAVGLAEGGTNLSVSSKYVKKFITA